MNILNQGLTTTLQQRGFKTSKAMGDLSSGFAQAVNAASRDYKSILNDETRTKGEKAPLLAKTQVKYKSTLAGKTDAILFNLESRASSLESQLNNATTFRGGDAVMILMAQNLQGTEDKLSRVKADPRYHQVVNALPADFFGIQEDALQNLKDAGLKKHHPELNTEIEQYKTDRQQMNAVLEIAKEVDTAFESSINPQAMQTRFDPE